MVCKNIVSGLECWKGPINFWYRHDCATHVTSDFKKHINKKNISGPDFNYQHFSDGTHTKGAGVSTNKGNGNFTKQSTKLLCASSKT